MQGTTQPTSENGGFCLAEVMLCISLIAICAAIGFSSLSGSIQRQQARASAQSTQAAAAWAQTRVLWLGEKASVLVGKRGPELLTDSETSFLHLNGLVPSTDASANVSRWRTVDGILLGFVEPFAAPDSGGSVYFRSGEGSYRLTVRPESGLTTRRWEE